MDGLAGVPRRDERISDGERQLGKIAIMIIEQRARQHVGTRDGELERPAGHARGARAVFGEIQRAFRDRAVNDRRWLAAETHFGFRAKRRRICAANISANAAEFVDEVFNHPVRIRMIHIKAIQLAVGG